MSFLTICSLSARPRRRLVLGRDGELGPISPNETDDLLEQMTARPEASTPVTSHSLSAVRNYLAKNVLEISFHPNPRWKPCRYPL
jgi:hypothetical protein